VRTGRFALSRDNRKKPFRFFISKRWTETRCFTRSLSSSLVCSFCFLRRDRYGRTSALTRRHDNGRGWASARDIERSETGFEIRSVVFVVWKLDSPRCTITDVGRHGVRVRISNVDRRVFRERISSPHDLLDGRFRVRGHRIEYELKTAQERRRANVASWSGRESLANTCRRNARLNRRVTVVE